RDAPNVETHGRVELERLATGGRLRIAEHDADLLAQLVDEDDRGLRARYRAGELAQRLAHEARLETHVRLTHVALDLGFRHQCGYGVDHDHVYSARPNENLADLKRLLTGIRLRDEEALDVHAQLA